MADVVNAFGGGAAAMMKINETNREKLEGIKER